MTITDITPEGLQHLVEEDSVVLFDVRSTSEFQSGHIKSSINIPVSEFIDQELKDEYKNSKIAIYCFSGTRSLMACNGLLSNYPNCEILHLNCGIKGWVEQGFEIQKLSDNT